MSGTSDSIEHVLGVVNKIDPWKSQEGIIVT
jgi:hypothetical protein